MDAVLKEALLEEKDKWHFATSDRYFVPQHRIIAIMTDASIDSALRGYGMEPYELHQVSVKVKENGRKTFAILIAIGSGDAIRTFVEQERYSQTGLDTKLPLARSVAQQYIGDKAKAGDFDLRQWELIAPVFYEGEPHSHLANATILPFTFERRLGKDKEGSFGAIYEVRLPRSHVPALATTEEEVSARDMSFSL